MKTRTPLIRAAIGIALVGAIVAFAHGSIAIPTPKPALMSVDGQSAVHATLLPTVSVHVDAIHPDEVVLSVATTEPLPVTLLPTVHVGAHGPALAALAPALRALVKVERTRVELLDM